jgi:succinyl-diaminopimelate desuccinylase
MNDDQQRQPSKQPIGSADTRGIIDVDEAAELTTRLVGIRSYPGEEAAVQAFVADWFERHGIAVERQPTRDGRSNIIARVERGPGATMLFNGHVDTVLAAAGWEHDPWRVRRDGEALYGLGVADMKSGVAAMMLATRALAHARHDWRGTVIATSVVDEEAFSVGARALVDAGIRADYCIVTEPSWHHPCLGGVGKVLVVGDVVGKAAHGSLPEEGINAAVAAAQFIVALDALPLAEHPQLRATQSLLSLHSGSPQYVITVPEQARFVINRHTVPGESGAAVLAQLQSLVGGLGSPARFALEIQPPYYPAWETPPSHPFVAAFGAAYQRETGRDAAYGYLRGVADANYFSADCGIPTIVFGPDGGKFHQAGEWVALPTIAGCARVLVDLTATLLAGR